MYDLAAQSSEHTTLVNSSATSLPYRPTYPDHMNQSYNTDPNARELYTPSLSASLTSDTATESTLMSYQEPALVTPVSYDFSNTWPGGQHTLPYSLPPQHQPDYQVTQPDYYYHQPSTASTRGPSSATDHTYIGDYNWAGHKVDQFDSNLATFWLDDDETAGVFRQA